MRPQDLRIGSLFESIRDAVIVADAKTRRIVLWNEAATKIFGYSTSEALELHVEALVPDYLEAHRSGIARYAEIGDEPNTDMYKPLELSALRKNGEEIWVEPWRARAFPILKDLVVDRSAFDRVVQAGGYISANTGGAPDGNAILVPKRDPGASTWG